MIKEHGKCKFQMLGIAAALFLLAVIPVGASENFCSQTADSLLSACKATANGDRLVKNANCI